VMKLAVEEGLQTYYRGGVQHCTLKTKTQGTGGSLNPPTCHHPITTRLSGPKF
jgi:hypothetical protein